MLRRLGGCAVALALLVPAQATASPTAPAERAQATTKTKIVKLGHKPVRATTSTKVRLVFEGRKGQLVNLARVGATDECGGRVLRSGGKTVKHWAQGFWRLPRTATYTAINKPCRGAAKASVKLQVRKVVREDRLLPDSSTAVGSSTKVTHLVPFRILAQQIAQVNAGTFDLLRPDRSIVRNVGNDELAHLVSDMPGPMRYDQPSPVGRYFAVVDPGTTVSLGVTQLQPVAVDGPAVTVTRGTKDNVAAYLVFTGEAGQWIYPELTSATNDPTEVRWWIPQTLDVLGESPAAARATCPGGDQTSYCPIIQLPASGTYVMNVINGPGYGTAVNVRVRSAARATPATVNGSTVTYTVTNPGQWVVGELPELPRQASGGSDATVTLSNPTGSLGDWRVRTVSGYGRCNASVDFAACFDIHAPANAFTMTPTSLTSPAPWDAFEHSSVAILAVPPGATGSLDLAVTRPAS
ncbi:hypothetical protein J2X46_002204 [Nocardioides sp. BE266]|uniref:hypothetical protein n=1 Tax=Nocardioides sp. BE266 TaxID=2817725 RepID=UPI0028609E25|nr:hypothetical protein [Nocardioides sp. BE266]MDR7253219.1 hypothetical protein [Nocardioides sp. BE266]